MDSFERLANRERKALRRQRLTTALMVVAFLAMFAALLGALLPSKGSAPRLDPCHEETVW